LLADILKSIDTDGATIYEIQSKTGISYQHLKKYLTYLVQNGLTIYSNKEKKFKMALPGMLALDKYIKMEELLVRRTFNIERSIHVQ
jgi:predicted transcriptional regulator